MGTQTWTRLERTKTLQAQTESKFLKRRQIKKSWTINQPRKRKEETKGNPSEHYKTSTLQKWLSTGAVPRDDKDSCSTNKDSKRKRQRESQWASQNQHTCKNDQDKVLASSRGTINTVARYKITQPLCLLNVQKQRYYDNRLLLVIPFEQQVGPKLL